MVGIGLAFAEDGGDIHCPVGLSSMLRGAWKNFDTRWQHFLHAEGWASEVGGGGQSGSAFPSLCSVIHAALLSPTVAQQGTKGRAGCNRVISPEGSQVVEKRCGENSANIVLESFMHGVLW